MLKLTHFLTRPMATAVAIALLGMTLGSVQGAIVQSNSTDTTSEVFYTPSAVDLINLGSTALLSQSTTPGTLSFGSGANLNDGNVGVSGDLSTTAAHVGAVWSAEFILDTTTNTFGYDVTGVDTYAGWDGMGNPDQNYELFVSVVGDASFTSLGNFSLDLNSATGGSTRIELTDTTGVIATGVDALRFDFPSLAAGSTGVYREFDVFGAATIPEPNSMSLVAIGLVGMISRRKRNRF